MKKIFFIFTFLIFLFASTAYATPIQILDQLCIKVVKYSSPKFEILYTREAGKSYLYRRNYAEGCLPLPEHIFERGNQIYYEGEAKRIKALIGNDELVNTELAPLKTTTNLITNTETKQITVYECPWHEGQTLKEAAACPLLFNFYKYTKDLRKYDGSSFRIFMDDNLVIDYQMSFLKGDMHETSGDNQLPPGPKSLLDQIIETITSLFSKFRL